jgi:hypothetical protein
MTQTPLPQQTASSDGPRALPPEAPGASEATRLLCAGTYFDSAFRDAVIDELWVHEERIAAPSLGIDATRVLAHALRARRIELGWAAAILLVWVVAVPLTRGMVLIFLPSFLCLALAALVRGSDRKKAAWYRRALAWYLSWSGRLGVIFSLWLLLAVASSSRESVLGIPLDLGEVRLQAWLTLLLPVLVAWAMAVQRGQFARALTEELSRPRFPDQANDPAEPALSDRFDRLRRSIDREQRSRLVLYRAENPFCGAGQKYEPWSFSVELRPRSDLEDREPEPMDNSAVLRRIVPLLEALRIPSPHGAPSVAAAVRDRLRNLEIDEVVFLPVDGLPGRSYAPHGPEAFEGHRSRAIEEGGETRRHYLRVRVGGWGEGIVTTVFVRVHTQGGMLMMEVAPHVLRPVKSSFQDADRVAYHYRHHTQFGKAVWALGRVPVSIRFSVVTLWRGAASLWRRMAGGYGRALPDGPLASVRELGSDDESSLFQEMDISRYLKSIQDRAADGVKMALADAGWQTDEFEQKIVNVAAGAAYIERVRGPVAIGDHSTVTSIHTTKRSGDDGGSS